MIPTYICHRGPSGLSLMCESCTEIVLHVTEETIAQEGNDRIAEQCADAAIAHRCEGSAVH